VLCSVCLADIINGEFQPVFLTRNEFLRHWVERHLSSLVAVATFSVTSLNSRLYQGHAIYLLASHTNYSEDPTDSPHLMPTNYSGFQIQLSFSKILSNAILRPASLLVVSSTPAPGPSQPVPSGSASFPGPSHQVPFASGFQPSAPSGSRLRIPSDLTFPSAHAASFAASYAPDADAEDKKLLDVNNGTPEAENLQTENLLDTNDETLGIVNMDTSDHQNFPTASKAYKKKPAVSDADAVQKAKKGAKKK
jgi:hypothetical protein